MEPFADVADEDLFATSGDLCPIALLRDVADSLADATRAFSEDLELAPTDTSTFGRAFSSAILANGVFMERLSGVASRFDPTRSARPAMRVRSRPSAATTRARAAAARSAAPPESARTVMLSGKPGTEVVGAFALENRRAEPIRATVLATAFVDLNGDPVAVTLRLEPAKVVLEPGEEVVVKVTATIPDDLSTAELLQGAIHVPGLTSSMVPVIMRSA